MAIDEFAPNLSFFFSNGMDPEYAVSAGSHGGSGLARCASATAPTRAARCSSTTSRLRAEPARPGDRVQRHPHHPAGALRLVRQLQQPAHERLRRGDHHAHRGVRAPSRRDPAHHQPRTRPEHLREPVQGSFVINELTDLVEAAVYEEFDRISERGGVLGAMDTMYQRSKIQEESLLLRAPSSTTGRSRSSASTPSSRASRPSPPATRSS